MIHVNNSLLTLLAECETKTWLRWGQEVIWREKQGAGPMEVGQVLHEVLAYWLGGGHKHGALDILDASWNAIIGEELPKQERLQKANVRLCFKHWIDQQPMRDVRVLATERVFEVPLGFVNGEEVMYYGTPDAVLEWRGELYVLDHKSTGDIDENWAAQWTMNTGLQGYVWGLRQLGHTIKGAFVNGIEIKRLPPWDGNLEKKCQTHKVKYKECQPIHVTGQWVGPLWWSEKRLEQWKRDVLSMVPLLQRLRDKEGFELDDRVGGVRMDGQWRWPGCNGGRGRAPCQYRGWCQAGRPIEGLTQMMTPMPWRKDTVRVEDEA
jgi:hypothetical protein